LRHLTLTSFPTRRSSDLVDQVFPLLTPQAITRAPGYPFPVMANLRLSLAALVRDSVTGPVHFAYVKLPDGLSRLVPLPDDGGLRSEEHTSELQSRVDLVC